MPPFHSPKKTLFKTSFFFCMFQKTGYRKSRASIRYQWMRIEECSPGSLLQMHDSKERSSFIAGTYTFYLWTLCVFLWQISVFLEEFRGLISSMVFLFDRLFFLKRLPILMKKWKRLERVQFHATDGSSTNAVEICQKQTYFQWSKIYSFTKNKIMIIKSDIYCSNEFNAFHFRITRSDPLVEEVQ